ncbi:MAG: polysaccharide biosynthesis tyrosine autokinase [Anaerolineaceae bacterium]|nr:polysaccharide biosynthesis tyrosine autokinase [Anaerolineaceae bacterium]
MNAAPSPITVVIKIVLKWWWLIAISVALGAGVGFYIRSKQPDIFAAKATLLFGQGFVPQGGTQGLASAAQVSVLMEVYSGLIRQPRILRPVIEDLNLGVTVDQLNGQMAINILEQLPLMDIIVTDTDPGRASDIANRVAQEMITQSPTATVTEEEAFLRAQLRDIQSQIEQLQRDYDTNVAEGAELESAVDIAQNLTERKAISSAMRELQTLYSGMSSSVTDSANQLTLFEAASPNSTVVASGSILGVVLSGMAGLMLSITAIIVITVTDDRLQWQEGGPEMIEGVRVLGPLGLVPRNKLPLYVVTIPDSVEAEVLRQIRARLTLINGNTPPGVLTVTSFESGDGKTVTSANIALAAAQSGLRTLLIDGDMRKGDLHEMFRLPNMMGLSDILASREDLDLMVDRALLDSGYDRLTVLTCGRSNADAAALLSGPRFGRLVDIFKRQFEFIVMDSVPSIGGPDAAFLSEHSDGVVIVVHAQRTTHKGLLRILQTLQQGRDVKIYGMVFNRTPLQLTSTYNQPYYRRTAALNVNKFNQELINPKTRSSLLRQGNVLADKNGNRLYSFAAAGTHLGVSHSTIQEWVKSGYLKVVRRGRYRWISEADLETLITQLPRQSLDTSLSHLSHETSESGDINGKAEDIAKLPDILRNQRQALLDYASDTDSHKQPDTEVEPESEQ